ncbi:MAG: SMC family ATPase, partial [Bacteroidales bacterium]|nr:SMC family ATPase [Bacteroidales bacterium]
ETAENLKKQLAETETKKSRIEEKNNLLNNLLKLTSEYDSKKNELNDLSSQKPKIDQKEQLLKQYNECMSLFAEDIATRKKSISNITNAQNNLAKITKAAEQQEKVVADTKQKFEQYESEYNRREEKQNAISSLELVMKINNLLNETALTEKQKAELDSKQKSTESSITESQNKKTALAAECERLQTSAMEVNELIDLQAWLTKYTTLLTDRNSKRTKQTEIQKEEEELQKTINDFLAKREYLKGYEPTIGGIGHGIENKINSLNDNIRKETEELQKLQVKQELYHYSTALQEGKPCPLCGSTHHPTVANHNVENEIKELKTKIDKLSSEKENLATKGMRWVNAKALEQTNRQRQTAELNTELHEIETEIGKQIEAFRWPQFSHSDSSLQEKINIENQKIKQIELLAKEIARLEKQLSNLREERDRQNTAIQNLSNTILTNQTIVGEQMKSIAPNIWEKYKNASESEINTLIHTLRTNIQQTETNYQQLKTLNNEHTATLHQLQGQKESTEKQLADFENDLKEIDNKLICKINIGQYQSISEVERIINQNLDSNAIAEEINNFNNNVAAIDKRLAELATLIGNNSYSPEEHKALKQQLENIAEEEKTLKEKQAVCNAKIKTITEKLTTKQRLAKEYDELTKRKTNLETLQKIFKASGFVDYVSTIYLENLVRTANERFRKMTKQQLELILNKDNEFEIRDYLNEGKIRSIKTLSGGQTFQVSLALALALIDNIHCFANDSKKFFFLDEGFGSQDKDSLNIIFDTLKSLRNENRVVGIISHVDELQQRIPTNIHIIHSEEKGSIIGNF